MRAYLASTIGVACTAALALPIAVPTGAAANGGRPERPVHVTASSRTAVAMSSTSSSSSSSPVSGTAPAAPGAARKVPGSTRSLPLVPLAPATAHGSDRALAATAEQGLAARRVTPYSLLGVTWDDSTADINGSVQVRTRAAATGAWSGWQDVQAHNDDAPDPGGSPTRGATAPLWVGASDGVQVRVRPGAVVRDTGDRSAVAAAPLPKGLRLEMVDPGDEMTPEAAEQVVREASAQAGNDLRLGLDGRGLAPGLVPVGAPAAEIPALSRAETAAVSATATATEAGGTPYIGARPKITTRAGWGADESLREAGFVYTDTVKVAFVHHTATGNGYSCSEGPALIRSIYRYHVESSGWRDIGYNFLVDKCGTIYEGRAGGVGKAVFGAHTLGFNTNSMGVAVLGTFTSAAPSAAALNGVSHLLAWKLGLFGSNPEGTAHLTSGGGNLYAKGTSVKLNVISGHRDGFNTECPGAKLYARLGSVRQSAADLQGR
ncbi:peptidoglycan recognition protein [Streptomyces sp. H10-C2]|uniref:peptidoglycan recognition protein family protein n=1 Tax=unclassified Streptomyces TaxID=2593676 RepID=UPI0024B98348|nr:MULTISPECIES: peptidoglycan recognition protein [unclassified Streptomyces]MDJ0341263.1 peptidoglycan recognition protein [Streptomyces sp. PH10-H1]MDJ0370858.1 peptidoglycan recognition protein [Streptomyces sp. H10-C2]